MMVHLQPMKMLVWSLVLVMGVLVMGCGHRSSHGSQTHSKKFQKARMMADQSRDGDSSLAKNAVRNIGHGEGYFGNDSDRFSDVLDEEALIQEDTQFGNDPTWDEASNDYWLNRTRAEQLTAASDLEDVHFAFNSIELNEHAKSILMANAEWLKAHPEAEVTIEGHCDDRGTSSYNYVLGEKRALRTKNYLTRLGISSERLSVMSFGKDNPACRGTTEPCYQKNRRAHLVLGITVTSTAMR